MTRQEPTSRTDPGRGTTDPGRERVYREIRESLGVVPSMFDHIPDASLDLEWQLFKQVHLSEGAIPTKYRELAGLAIGAAVRDRYCAYAHTEFARVNGATEAEIEEVLHFAKSVAGWSSFANGTQLDFERFKSEIDDLCQHVRQIQKAA